MKLEIDIDEDYYKIICKRVQDNKPFHSPYEYEVIADGKPIEQEPFINKSCVSGEVCEHDKQIVLDKIKAEIWQIIDNYKAESED